MKWATYFSFSVLLFNLFSSVHNFCGSETQNASSYPVGSVIYNGDIKECGCSAKQACIRKCCGINYVLRNETCVFDNVTKLGVLVINDFKEINDEDLFEFRGDPAVPGMVKCMGKNTLFALHNVSVEDAAIVQTSGRLWFHEANLLYNFDEYCLESVDELRISIFICPDNYVDDFNFADRLSFVGAIISMPFLLATFIVYALLPERTLHGKSLMCYVVSLFGAYFLLVFSHVFTGNVTFSSCKIIGMLALFCFIASFFWMNAMSYDIYSTFRGSRGFSGNRKEREGKRFLMYSAYAWGGPTFIIALILTLSNTVKPNVWYDPGVRGEECFLRDGIPELMYFYAPLAVLISANIVMFGITAWKIKQVQKDTAMLTKRGSKKHSSGNDDTQRFQLYIKLLFAMGINWSVEIINWAVTWQVKNVPPAVWYVTDFFNAVYGVVIFIIFVCTRSIWKQLKKRYYMVTGKKPKIESTSSKGTAESSLTQQ